MIGIGSGLGRVGGGARLTLPLAPTILSVADRGNGTCDDRGHDHPSAGEVSHLDFLFVQDSPVTCRRRRK